MDKEDQKLFVEYVFSQGDMIIEERVKNDFEIQPINNYENITNYKYYIYNPSLEISVSGSGFINALFAEVIEFKPCEIRGTQLVEGRLWFELVYYDENQDRIHKSDELDKMFNKYKRYITKYYKISKDKSEYVGPGAYKLYKKGWIMGFNELHPVEFDDDDSFLINKPTNR